MEQKKYARHAEKLFIAMQLTLPPAIAAGFL